MKSCMPGAVKTSSEPAGRATSSPPTPVRVTFTTNSRRPPGAGGRIVKFATCV